MSASGSTPETADVIIMGGGLAGLTLALQLRQRFADPTSWFSSAAAHPVPPAAHKVGESSVEIGAHYFSTRCSGSRSTSTGISCKKFGFRFFFSEAQRDIDQRHRARREPLSRDAELSDRPRHLSRISSARTARSARRALSSTCAVVRGFDHGGVRDRRGAHVSRYFHATKPSSEVEGPLAHRCLRPRRASSKASSISPRSNDHDANAIWFRIDDRIDVRRLVAPIATG